MANNEARISNRKKAYSFVREQLCAETGESTDISDKELANILGGTIELEDELSGLQKGTLDPSSGLVRAFKQFVGPRILESIIDSYLVDPFMQE